VALAAAALSAHAQDYPVRPVRLVVTFPPGSGVDIVARSIGQKMSEALGHQVVVDNRAGAGGILGTEIAARAAPDGYTLVMVSSSFTINGSVYARLPYDPLRDFAPVTLLASTPYLLVVHPPLPARDVRELIQLARTRPGFINYGSGGIGVGSHLAGELFATMAAIQITNVPYKGAPQATSDTVAGQVQMSFSTLPTALPLVKAGRLRALGVTSARRLAIAPELATVAEAGLAGFEAGTWQGILAPAGLPSPRLRRVNGEAVAAVKASEVSERLVVQGYEVIGSTPESFARAIRDEIAKWAKVVKAAGIKPLSLDAR
jgi:tripartite-type tricarboxylate transporter receptor subunit TctC